MKNVLKITIVILVLAFPGRMAFAQAPEAQGIFKLKHVSTFKQTSAHNPFWPIGWVRTANVQQQESEPQVPITSANFNVSSISISPTPMAIINNKACAEGETITARYGASRIQIQVMAIRDGEVILQYQGQNYTIPLKRPELTSKPANEEPPTMQETPMILH